MSAVRRAISRSLFIVAAVLGPSGCLDRPLCAATSEASSKGLPEGFSGDCDPETVNVFVAAITRDTVDKIDLLFMIDNSASMADKQRILRDAVPDLVRRLVDPVCIDHDDGSMEQAPGPRADCPAGSARQLHPVRDIHIGVISSSMGSYAAGPCDASEATNDRGRLIGSRPRAASLDLPGSPFLSWFVANDADEPQPSGTFADIDPFNALFQSMVTVVGEQGCAYEASLEAWYRFLVDPAPPESFRTGPCDDAGSAECIEPVGTDDALLRQRAAFLRPDSLVAIIMLSDENDCSIQGAGQLYHAAQDIALPKASAACATNPNDPCCFSCGDDPPASCSADPSCKDARGDPAVVPKADDKPNLRCFNQKTRFGVDFLFPTERYVNALRSSRLCVSRPDLSTAGCAEGDLRANPLYQDASKGGRGVRGPDLVFLAGIVGVPYQDIAANVDPDGEAYPSGELHFQTAAQMNEQDTWSDILGFPDGPPGQGGNGVPVPPRDPLMRESVAPRTGNNPVVPEADPVAPEAGGYMENPINGHEWTVIENDDVQYACIFPLPDPIDCTEVDEGIGCDCRFDPVASYNPLCQAPGSGPGEGYGSIQYAAKAYPGLRFLEVLRAFGHNAIVASICPRNLKDPTAQDFGYRPAIGAIVARLREALLGRCLPRAVPVGEDGQVPCSVVEAVPEPELGCDRPGRKAPDRRVVEPAFRRLEQAGRCGGDFGRPCDDSGFTMCEIVRANERCLEDRLDQNSVGWCYVDPAKGLGDESLVDRCDPNERRLLRFVDPNNSTPAQDATVLIACLGADLSEDQGGGSSTPTGGSGGAPAAGGTGGASPAGGGTGGTAPPAPGDAGP